MSQTRQNNTLSDNTNMFEPVSHFFQSNGLWVAGFIFYVAVALITSRYEDRVRHTTSERRLSKGITSKQL